jgi:hypothetical protein
VNGPCAGRTVGGDLELEMRSGGAEHVHAALCNQHERATSA